MVHYVDESECLVSQLQLLSIIASFAIAIPQHPGSCSTRSGHAYATVSALNVWSFLLGANCVAKS